MKRGVFIALATAALLIPGIATAQDLPQGLYLEGRAGVSFPSDIEITDDPLNFVNSGGKMRFEVDSAPDYVLAGAVGYAHKSGWRVEVEASYRRHNLERLFAKTNLGAVTQTAIDVDANIITGMVNTYFDFDPSLYGAEGFPLVPFVGLGIGGMRLEFDPGDQDVAFAFQLIGGVTFHLTPFTALSISYNYLSAENFQDDGFRYEYESHNFMGGLRLTF